MTTEVTPHAAGLARFCSSKKDYIGKSVVDAQRTEPPAQCFVTVEVDMQAPPCWGTEPVFKDTKLVGYVTSGGMGWRCGKMLAVCWVDRTEMPKAIMPKAIMPKVIIWKSKSY